MSLNDLSDLGQFISSIAVLASLVYVSIQIRQAERNQRANIQSERASRSSERIMQLADPYLSEVVARAEAGDPSLTSGDINAYVRIVSAFFQGFEDGFLQYRAGTLEEAGWRADARTIDAILSYQSGRFAWDMVREFFSGEFLDYVDSRLKQVPLVGKADYAGAWQNWLGANASGQDGWRDAKPDGQVIAGTTSTSP